MVDNESGFKWIEGQVGVRGMLSRVRTLFKSFRDAFHRLSYLQDSLEGIFPETKSFRISSGWIEQRTAAEDCLNICRRQVRLKRGFGTRLVSRPEKSNLRTGILNLGTL